MDLSNQENIRYLQYLYEKRGREHKQNTVIPADIFNLAMQNNIVNTCVSHCWTDENCRDKNHGNCPDYEEKE